MKKNTWKKGAGRRLSGLLLMAALLTGCGSSGSMYEEMAYDAGGAAYTAAQNTASDTAAAEEYGLYDSMAEADYETAAVTGEAPQEMPGISEDAVQTEERKLIKTVDLYAETESYDALLVNLEAQIAAFGGYIEYQYQYNGSYYSNYDEMRSANLSVRIPAERLDEFIRRVGEQSNITNREERVEDVTLRYVDLESYKKALTIEQERLLDLLEKAESVEDIITIEQRLSEVRYELENMESQLRTLNNQIDYSTINISIQEVKRVTPVEEKSAWDKMKNGFVKSIYRIGDDMENGFIRFVINIPYLLIWIVVFGIAFVIVRAVLKKRKRKKAEKEQNEQRWLESRQKQEEILKEEEKKERSDSNGAE
ncbi:MAG: DUF4349 domain-containing protein [Blautia sp.]|nr:DUF4349 domain-containing protein [Blautia sp.]MCM1200400.1 DUF4349 domain-containing protein [Bacteroides fragilis]